MVLEKAQEGALHSLKTWQITGLRARMFESSSDQGFSMKEKENHYSIAIIHALHPSSFLTSSWSSSVLPPPAPLLFLPKHLHLLQHHLPRLGRPLPPLLLHLAPLPQLGPFF